MDKRLIQFVSQANIVHDTKYDYSLVEYVNVHTPVTIICPIHGKFEKRPVKHISNKEGCPTCSKLNRIRNKTLFKSFNDVCSIANTIHQNKYEYLQLIQHNQEYVTTNDILLINCIHHGKFKQTINKHIYQTTGCRQCFTEYNRQQQSKTTEQFVLDSIKVHGQRYSYENTQYINSHTNVTITCPDHGNFSINPANHILKQQGCNICAASGPELIIRQYLIDNNIKFEYQYKLDGCVSPITQRPLKYDFYIPSYSMIIEYDGIYHYQPIDHGNGQQDHNFKKQQLYDTIKNQYAEQVGITLIRIPYNDNLTINERLYHIFKNSVLT